METDDLRKLMSELLAAHKETEHHVVRMMERQGDLEAMMKESEISRKETQALIKQGAERQRTLEELVKQVAENNIRLSRIIEAHDYDIEDLDVRLRRLEERKRNGRT
jgi:hypothetical protein